MSGIFDSTRGTSRLPIFGDGDDDGAAGHDFLSSSRNNTISSSTTTTMPADSHSSALGLPSTSQNIARLPSPAALQQDDFSTPPQAHDAPPPDYDTPTPRVTPQRSRPSYDSPAADPWSSTPRTNGVVPVAVPNFPPSVSSRPSLGARSETASYLLDADHITIQKTDEKEGFIGFKHVNYTLASARRGTLVVRRYSDFSWLYDALVKRYPFRQVPLLPPKRLAGSVPCKGMA